MYKELEKQYGALLAYPWIKSETNECEIIGNWAEDGRRYAVSCPGQLRDQLLRLQNSVFAQMDQLRQLQAEVDDRERQLRAILEGKSK